MILILSQFGYESLFYLRLALLESIFCSYAGFVGGVAEWLNAPVLKTDVGESLPWVRIPPPPPYTPNSYIYLATPKFYKLLLCLTPIWIPKWIPV